MDYVLVTQDAKTMPGVFVAHLRAGRHSPGLLNARPPINDVLVEWLVTIAVTSEPNELTDQTRFVP